MRFAIAHKTATYLMVGFAFLAMTMGGGMPPIFAIGGAIGLVISWWWEPPRIRYERWGWVWTVASIFALVYSILSAILTGDFLGVGAQFLIWLCVAKAFNRRAARDWQQMYLLAFLMLVAGSVLNPELTYGLCFLGFVITSTWAMTLFHLRREMEDNLLVKHASDRASERVEVRRILDSRRIVGRRFFVGTGLLSFVVFLGSAAVFLALPRVGIGFFLKGRAGLTLAGFSDGVKLGGHGVIKDDPTVVMRVEIDARYGGLDAPQIHWRGVAFDRYDKGRWSRSANAPRTLGTLEQDSSHDRRFLQWEGPLLPSEAIDDLETRTVRQDVWLEPLDSDVLFGAGKPRVVDYAHTMRPRRPVKEQNDEIRLEHGSTLHYDVFSQLEPPPPADLRAATGPLPAGYAVYLALPPEITPRTKQLARTITANATTEYDKVIAIQRWLADNLTYTLELEDPGAQEPVDHFLFDRKKGHCEYFASGFAVLARAVGVPTRNVNGFLGGEWNEYKGYVAVRAGDAHSWDEVYFPGAGWTTIDPTPSATLDELGRGGSGWRAKLNRYIDTLRFQWSKWVIEYDLVSQLQLLHSIGGAIKDGTVAVKAAAVRILGPVVRSWPIALAIACVILAVVLVRRRRAPRVDAARSGRLRARSTVAEIYDAALRSLARAGISREPGTTPRELAARMANQRMVAADEVGELTELYYAAEWGGRRDHRAEELASELARRIRDAIEARRRAG